VAIARNRERYWLNPRRDKKQPERSILVKRGGSKVRVPPEPSFSLYQVQQKQKQRGKRSMS